ncbi:hypothetical protein CAEBREN_04879 [Caenorhabditis brenneri]|uniref:Uncharacterized protein n=1 Tax=Caenorhabditis brenneri TaxID=135651 RepID=G0P396_CAEBE|nr:hypothetical protein CAEBREN_04879 [Caenorhabditis brenneri]
MTEIMFERFNVPAYYAGKQATLSLLASCRTTGLVIDSGEGGTDIVSIYEGYAIPRTQLSLELGGQKLTDFFGTMLAERGYSFSTTIVQSIKEQLCYVAPNLEEGMNTAPDRESTYTLPDGRIISVGNQNRRCPEALFRPSLMNIETPGLHRKCYESILKCDLDIRNHICSNIILSGGPALFPGLGDRLKNELSKLVPSSTTINVLTPPEGIHPVWIGGSILASLVTFQQCFILKREYEESGSSIVHTKCIH